jgi:hypothetical protein
LMIRKSKYSSTSSHIFSLRRIILYFVPCRADAPGMAHKLQPCTKLQP